MTSWGGGGAVGVGVGVGVVDCGGHLEIHADRRPQGIGNYSEQNLCLAKENCNQVVYEVRFKILPS